MSALVVDVVFRGKVLESLPFPGPALRIGRMPENDVVLDNLGVSRFHARLVREGAAIFLEDMGSGNGCLVDGRRVAGRTPVGLGVPITIGKHELRVRHAVEGEASTRRPARRRDDAIDPARTYLLDAPVRPAVPAAPEPVPSAPEPSDKELALMASTPTPPRASAASPELDFDFVGALSEGEDQSGPATVPLDAPAPADAPAPQAAPMHAGFIVQRQGKLERVVAWHGDVLVAGRSGDCDVVLAQDEISRRHVRFERSGDRYELVDLGSVNGSFVNGRRVDRHVLSVGDVVQVEGFQLTFVLDRDPLDGAIAAQTPAATPARREDTFAMTMLQEEMPHRPGFTQIVESEPASAEAEALAEADLLPDDIEEIEALDADAEKPADEGAQRTRSRASSVQDLGRVSQPNLAAPELRFELRVRVDLLPPALRRAFEQAGATELVLPAELRLKAS
jgi:pSer/pThr/pTyr-binding forkhead associated (FHA) protein